MAINVGVAIADASATKFWPTENEEKKKVLIYKSVDMEKIEYNQKLENLFFDIKQIKKKEDKRKIIQIRGKMWKGNFKLIMRMDFRRKKGRYLLSASA